MNKEMTITSLTCNIKLRNPSRDFKPGKLNVGDKLCAVIQGDCELD